MPARLRASPIVSLSSAMPSRTAMPSGLPLPESGVNSIIGMMKTRYHSAESGPVARASSPFNGSSPNSGSRPSSVLPVSGEAARQATTKISAIMPPR